MRTAADDSFISPPVFPPVKQGMIQLGDISMACINRVIEAEDHRGMMPQDPVLYSRLEERECFSMDNYKIEFGKLGKLFQAS
jgi:hypothetical protein